MNHTTKETGGTSFHFTTIKATVQDLKQIMGKPYCECNTGKDKTNIEWVMETNDGHVFTVYDWKEYRVIDETEEIEWHIGGHNKEVTEQAKNEMMSHLIRL